MADKFTFEVEGTDGVRRAIELNTRPERDMADAIAASMRSFGVEEVVFVDDEKHDEMSDAVLHAMREATQTETYDIDLGLFTRILADRGFRVVPLTALTDDRDVGLHVTD